jgi:hypothetical protein
MHSLYFGDIFKHFGRRQERDLGGLKRDDKMFFVNAAFIIAWRDFLIGNGPPPSEKIDNSSLLWRTNHAHFLLNTAEESEVETVENVIRQIQLDHDSPHNLNPFMEPFQHFGIVSEREWDHLVKIYGGGPALSEDDVPANKPVYANLRLSLEWARDQLLQMD